MNLLDNWRFYLKNFPSPDLFIDWGWYSMVNAALQRRVWLPPDEKQLYPNMFTVLCGPPGVGKGMILGEVARVLKHKKLLKMPNFDEKRAELREEFAEVPLAKMNDEFAKMNNMLVPLSPQATTFESLCRTLAKANRHMYVTIPPGPDGKASRKVVQHSSLYVHLEELGSLFRRHTEDIHTLANETYDCKSEYEYRTKNQGTDTISNPCMNLLAGTTPDFLKRVFSSAILTEGFASRTVFAVAMKNRSRVYEIVPFTDEQKVADAEVVDHIAKLAKLQGRISFSPEAKEFNQKWYVVDYANGFPNPDPKLIPYYARVNITHQKLCVAMHLTKHDGLSAISLETAQEALKFLQMTEQTMHLALKGESKNPLSEATEAIEKFIRQNGKTKRKTLMTMFYDLMPDPQEDLSKILTYLVESGKIKASDEPNAFEPKREIE